jgi:hypothetical protein
MPWNRGAWVPLSSMQAGKVAPAKAPQANFAN